MLTLAKTRFSLAIAAVLSCARLMVPGTAGAGESSSVDGDNYLDLQVNLRDEAIIGDEQTRRIYVTVNTNTMAFILPRGFRLDVSNPTKIVLSESDSTFLVIRIVAPPSRETPPPSFRDILQRGYPDTTILNEFSQTSRGRTGPAFDLQSTNSNQSVQALRVLYVPSSVGAVEISLRSEKDKIAGSMHSFDRLRRSLQTDEDGPIKPIQAPTEPPRS